MTLFAKIVALANLGRGLGLNAVTKKVDVVVSADAGNTLSYGSDGNLLGGQFKSAINLGDTTPVPSGGDGSIAYSTTLSELVQWVVANGSGSWAKRYVGSTAPGTTGVPATSTANNGFVLETVTGTPTWINPNPFSGPIDGWPAGTISGGIG